MKVVKIGQSVYYNNVKYQVLEVDYGKQFAVLRPMSATDFNSNVSVPLEHISTNINESRYKGNMSLLNG